MGFQRWDMLPFEEAREVKKSILSYIISQYPVSDPVVKKEFVAFLERPEEGVFNDCEISLKLPYKQISEAESLELRDFLRVAPGFVPYCHQAAAFRHLASWNYRTDTPRNPEPVLLAAGAGSGKSAAFLYPILDYCFRENQQHRRKGVKAIIVYPVNDQAADQARCLAREIMRLPRDENGNFPVTAGLLTGNSCSAVRNPGGNVKTKNSDSSLPRDMGEDHIIENRDAILETVPDIIITSFRMLDRALTLRAYNDLWTGSIPADPRDESEIPGSEKFSPCLKFLVLDDMHTYDEVQSSDAAGLIRRLKLRLGLSRGDLCPAGTLVSTGSREDITGYARKIFGEDFAWNSVIFENRVSPQEFWGANSLPAVIPVHLPEVADPGLTLEGTRSAGITEGISPYDVFLDRLSRIWLPEYKRAFPEPLTAFAPPEKLPGEIVRRAVSRGRCLKTHPIFRALVALASAGSIPFSGLVSGFRDSPEFAALIRWSRNSRDSGNTVSTDLSTLAEIVAGHFLDLAAGALDEDSSPDRRRPFLFSRVTMWVRELFSAAREVSRMPGFVFVRKSRNAGTAEQMTAALPFWCCRKCGGSGWVGLRDETGAGFVRDFECVSRAFRDRNREVRLLVPLNAPGDRDYAGDFAALPDLTISYNAPETDGERLGGAGCTVFSRMRIRGTDLRFDREDNFIKKLRDPRFVNAAEVWQSWVPVYEYSFSARENGVERFVPKCPFCLSRDPVSVAGSRISSLSAAALNAVMGSAAESTEPESRKLLVFSGAAQDAPFLTGVYEDRSYRFFLRKAMAEYFSLWRKEHGAAGNSEEPRSSGYPELSLGEFFRGFISHFEKRFGCSGAALSPEFVFSFRPPLNPVRFRFADLAEESPENCSRFKRAFLNRLEWECINEFAGGSDDGQSLETAGTLTAGFSPEMVQRSAFLMQERLKSVPELAGLDSFEWLKNEIRMAGFIESVLQCFRIRGVVDNPYIAPFREKRLQDVYSCRLKSSGHGDDSGYDRFHELIPKFSSFNFPRIAVCDDDRVKNDRFGFFEVLKIHESSLYYELFCRAFARGGEFKTVSLLHDVREFYRELLDVMSESGLLRRLNAGGSDDDPALYVISPEALLLSERASVRYCPACLYRVRVPEFSRGADFRICTCLKKHTPDGGRAQDRDYLLERFPEEDDFGKQCYRELYDSGFGSRISAKEHNGLLNYGVRDTVGESFPSSGFSGAVTVFSATAALKTGIDTGDLNTVFLAGLPDTAAGYLQRAGCAGRVSGSSLVVNFARASSGHDLHAFETPGYLTEGVIAPPAFCLKSPDILKRNFLAFCFDRAALESFVTGDETPCIPESFNVADGRVPAFAAGIGDYISRNRDRLIREFRDSCLLEFRDETPESFSETENVFGELERQVASGMLTAAVSDAFTGLIGRIGCLNTRKSCYLDERERAEKSGERSLLRSMNVRIAAVSARIAALTCQDAPGFLAEQGLLPHYDLPEKGGTLTGEILDFAERDTGRDPVPEAFAVTVPAEKALTALAPDNTFYFNERRMTVLGVDPAALVSDSSPKAFSSYRYCSQCAALAREGTPEFDRRGCPKCGDLNWENNRHLFMSMPDMSSEMLREEAGIAGQNREEREQEHYLVKSHFDFDCKAPRFSFSLPENGFGMEYFGRITLLQVNYGNIREQVSHADAVVDGETVPRQGFVVCTSCGKATSLWNYHRNAGGRQKTEERSRASQYRGLVRPEDYHFGYCRHADMTELDAVIPGTSSRVFAETYLFRKLNTEGIRIRLPAFAGLAGKTSYFRYLILAGIRLGIESWFWTASRHLRFDFCSEVTENCRNEYIVIYDRIPGGTGDLKRLCSRNPGTGRLVFQEILERGLEALRGCPCEDGCYSCVYHYGVQGGGILSRAQAVMIMEALVKSAQTTGFRECRQGRGLPETGSEDTSPGIFRASIVELFQEIAGEYQDRFTEYRDSAGSVMRGVWLWEGRREEHPSGSATRVIEFRYRITLEGEPEEPHVSDEQPSRPDFLFEPEEYRITENGESKAPELLGLYKTALYLDSYRYHGDLFRGKVRFPGDLAARELLRKGNRQRSVQYLPWTLTWNDLSGRTPWALSGLLRQPKFPAEDQFARHFRSDFSETRKEILALNIFYGNSGRSTLNPFSEPVDQFLFVLLHPDPGYLRRIFFDLLWGITDPGSSADLVLADSVTAAPYLSPDSLMERKQACQLAIQEDRSRMSGLFAGRHLTLLEGPGCGAKQDSNASNVPPVWFSRGADAVPESYCINVRMNYPGTGISVHNVISEPVIFENGLDRAAWESFWQLYNMFALLPRYHEAAGEEITDLGGSNAVTSPDRLAGYTMENLPEFFEIPPGVVLRKNATCTREALEDSYGGELMEVMTLLADTGLLGDGFVCGHGRELDGHYAEFISEPLKIAVAPDAESREYFGQKGYRLVLSNHTDEGKTIRDTVIGLRARKFQVVLSCDFTLDMILKPKS
ncbi:Zn-binding domain-containing protein [Succinimonas amylolytica]|uniref:Zn-binding domain-containing protein n=1 Tax=Succinimonas amylolytica TaxID=83769 RepID=UPI00035EBE36|nr:Zn-binding domain-containing protein [Succinimonas amylolytica]